MGAGRASLPSTCSTCPWSVASDRTPAWQPGLSLPASLASAWQPGPSLAAWPQPGSLAPAGLAAWLQPALGLGIGRVHVVAEREKPQ